jgi:hypothetical protein
VSSRFLRKQFHIEAERESDPKRRKEVSMTVTINAGSGIHQAPPDAFPVPVEYLDVLQSALQILLAGMRGNKSCNDHFSSLPGGRDFRSLIDDHTIWIDYDPSNSKCGWCKPSTYPNDIVVCRYALAMGRWSVAATIVHELAHLDGAPGRERIPRSTVEKHSAEFSVRKCRMMSGKGPYMDTYVEEPM